MAGPRLASPPVVLLALLAAMGWEFSVEGSIAHGGEAAHEPLLERDVLPVLTKHCLGCHGGLRKQGGLDLRTVPAMLAGGESGPAIVSGHSSKSTLWERIASDEMPEGDDREKLSAAEKATLKAWIDAGLPTVSQRQGAIDPGLPADKKHDPAEVAQAIDRHLERFLTAAKLAPAERSDDQEFLRRVYLDLTGRVPTAEQTSAFLDDASPEKRAALIDALLESPRFGQQLGRTWRDWVSPPELPSDDNGGGQPHQQADAFAKWLGEKLSAGQSWDQITREILTVEGEIKKNPQVIFFGLVGQGGKTTPEGTTQAVASLFLGVQLQCAQCHDDPYRDWSQQTHWQLAAFFGGAQGDFNKLEVGKGPSKKAGEIIIPGSAFKNAGMAVSAAFPGESDSPPQRAMDGRKPFADWLTGRENPYFARSFVNRIWFYLFARGIVNPIDDFRELNPPSHPGLLALLENEFRASGYDIKHLFRCLCRSQAYQRTSRQEPSQDELAGAAQLAAFGRMPMRLLTADMLYDSLQLAFGEEKEFDLRTSSKDSTIGMAAPVAGPYLEFQRRFATSEDNAADFTHGVAQMLTLINHPRLLSGGKALETFRKRSPQPTTAETIDWLYRNTLSRPPSSEERSEAAAYVERSADPAKALAGVLWMLVNRSEFLLIP